MPIVPRGTAIAGAIVRVPARAVDATAHPLRDDGRVRAALAACVGEVERTVPGAAADVIDIDSVMAARRHIEVTGRVAVNRLGHAWRPGDRVYGRGWRGDFRGWTPALRGFDAVRFSCTRKAGQTSVMFI
ncbi:MAG: hypothetical protein IH997_12130 [Proteobacteria bacterium]|nr:hypothetical protein [Pseudomonadota bacterium]